MTVEPMDPHRTERAMYQPVVVSNPDGPDLEIEAVLLLEDACPDLGQVRVYRTRRGRYVIRQLRHALRGTNFIDRTGVLTDLEDVGRWLGSRGGAKVVMERLGRPMRIKVE